MQSLLRFPALTGFLLLAFSLGVTVLPAAHQLAHGVFEEAVGHHEHGNHGEEDCLICLALVHKALDLTTASVDLSSSLVSAEALLNEGEAVYLAQDSWVWRAVRAPPSA